MSTDADNRDAWPPDDCGLSKSGREGAFPGVLACTCSVSRRDPRKRASVVSCPPL